mgnify:CR=1 FL=1
MQSNPFHIAFKEAWEGGLQANDFGHQIGCPTLDKKCLRSKSYEQVKEAQGKTNGIINPDKLFLAANAWGPVIDGIYLKVE